jgi:hypothetical protein
MHFHRPGSVTLLQRIVRDEHIIPLVGHAELIVPKEVPYFVRRCILKDCAALVLRRPILIPSRHRPRISTGIGI